MALRAKVKEFFGDWGGGRCQGWAGAGPRTEFLRCIGPPRTEVLRRTGPPRVETLGYDWDNKVRRFAPVLESGLKSAALWHPCPCGCTGGRSPGRGSVCLLGYDMEGVVRRFAPVLESGLKSAALWHPCPCGCTVGKDRSGALRLFLLVGLGNRMEVYFFARDFLISVKLSVSLQL